MDRRVEFVVDFIKKNYQRRLTLTEMAKAVNLSPWRLCHLFKKEMNTSPERFLTRVRLEKGKELLETEFLAVKEVAKEVGMSDTNYFTRSFKAAYGTTPAKYKKNDFPGDKEEGIMTVDADAAA